MSKVAQKDPDWDGQDAENDEVQSESNAPESDGANGSNASDKAEGGTPPATQAQLPPSPWRHTTVPQPAATHPGLPKQAASASAVIAADESPLPANLREGFEMLKAAETALKEAQRKDKDKPSPLKVNVVKAWARLKKVRRAVYDLQQGRPLTRITAQEHGRAHAGHAASIVEYRLKILAYQNTDIKALIDERDGLEAKCDGMADDLQLVGEFLLSNDALRIAFEKFARAKAEEKAKREQEEAEKAKQETENQQS
ncbi:MAG TPA: hypothetical protein VGJ73_21235 [Verrucomicrobiae bacterium]|jgi:hypothetical protein